MQPYRFDRLVQGRLLQLQLAFFILVKVIPTLMNKHTSNITNLILKKQNNYMLFNMQQNTQNLPIVLQCIKLLVIPDSPSNV